MSAYIAKTDGTRVPLVNDLKLTPEVVQDLLKIPPRYIERVAPRKTPEVIFLCHEEGHLIGLPLNAHGEELYGGPIAGDILVIYRSDPRHRRWL